MTSPRLTKKVTLVGVVASVTGEIVRSAAGSIFMVEYQWNFK